MEPTLDWLKSLIESQTPEGMNLEFKRKEALENGDAKEVTKDITSMANSAGGTIIYGMVESGSPPVAASLEGFIGRTNQRDRLDQICGQILPPIPGLKITPVADGDATVLVVQVPMAETAHQGSDGRYYRRMNSTTRVMPHFEIVECMRRRTVPKLDVCIRISGQVLGFLVVVKIKNLGAITAHSFKVALKMPLRFSGMKVAPEKGQRTLDTDDSTCRWLATRRFTEPLYPQDEEHWRYVLEEVHGSISELPKPPDESENIEVSLFTDGTEPIRSVKSIQQALRGWV